MSTDQLVDELNDGYSMINLGSIYGGMRQRWQLIFSEQAYRREQLVYFGYQ